MFETDLIWSNYCICFSQEQAVVSWFEVALKLRLPELISQNSKDRSILENVVQALVRESSVRSRQPPEVILTGLAAMPKTVTLPHIVDHQQEVHTLPIPRSPAPTSHLGTKIDTVRNTARNSTARNSHVPPNQQNHLIKRQLETIEKQFTIARSQNKPVLSNEAWIPNELRMKTLGRDITAASDALLIIKKREISMAREMRRLDVTDLQRAQTEEGLGATHKLPCECCMQEFLYVNLPLRVSRKAIVDIRTKWSGKLSSATVFGGPEAISDEEFTMQADGTMRSTQSPSKSKSALEKKSALLSGVPSCYDEVSVCIFCAQFFHVQEDYRPSYLAITQNEKRAAAKEARRREKEYWDPLKMVEKDRKEQELRDQMTLSMQMQEEGAMETTEG